MPPFIDLTGRVFGRLTVLRPDGYIRKRPAFLCLCECTNQKRILGNALTKKYRPTRSCGCLKQTRTWVTWRTFTPAGASKQTPREYLAWRYMIGRCFNPRSQAYPDYGGRGITVCERWRYFANFIADMGLRPSPKHSLDRVNVNGNYEPSNCKWATWHEQGFHKRKYLAVENFSDSELRQECARRGFKFVSEVGA